MMRIRSPLEFPNGHPCLKIQQGERLEDERLSDLVALGMPSDDHVRLTIKGEFFDIAFANYTLELYGFWPEDLEPNQRDQRPWTPSHTLVYYPSKASGHIFKVCYYFWLQRVRYGSETIRELIWHPDARDYLSIKRNVWVRYSEPAKTLLSHVQHKERRVGRPVRFNNKEQFLAALEEAAEQLESNGQPLTQPNIAELIKADERDVRRGCDRFKVDWQQWKRNRNRETKPDKHRN